VALYEPAVKGCRDPECTLSSRIPGPGWSDGMPPKALAKGAELDRLAIDQYFVNKRSAISTASRAAPRRKLSLDVQKIKPFSTLGSYLKRLT
jgi:hypothetical protein